MPAVLKNDVDDSTILQNQRVIDMRPKVAMIDGNATPLCTFLMHPDLQSEDCFSTKKEWLEDEPLPRIGKLSATQSDDSTAITYSTSNTTFAVLQDSGPVTGIHNAIKKWDLLHLEKSGENVLITSDVNTASSTTQVDFTVRRNIGNLSTQGQTSTPALNDYFSVIGNMMTQGAGKPDIRQTKLVAQYNYTGIFRDSLGFSESLIASNLYGGNILLQKARQKLVEHKIKMDLVLMLGRRDAFSASTSPANSAGAQTTLGGVMAFMLAAGVNIIDNANAALTQSVFDAWLEQVARFSDSDGGNYVLLVAPLVARYINSFAYGKLTTNDAQPTKWGVAVKSYQNIYGDTLPVVIHKRWRDMPVLSAAASMPYSLNNSAFLLNMDNIELTFLRTRQTRLIPKIQNNDVDATEQEYKSEFTMQFRLPRTHGWIRNILTSGPS